MRDELFSELVESVKEGGAILQGEADPSRQVAFEAPNVAEIREEYGLSQTKFAALLGISVRTLQNWEQGRRHPQGPARILLRVAAKHPRAVLDSVKWRFCCAAKMVTASVARESDAYRDSSNRVLDTPPGNRTHALVRFPAL